MGNNNDLAYFTDSINTLIEGQLIMVNKNIASVLRCIAGSEILCKCLSETLRLTSYATEMSRARVTWTRSDGVVVSQLKLPQDRNRLFAFVVCLLTEVDSGRRNFLDFLREYYTDEYNNPSYAKFADEVLRPFKAAVTGILSSIDPDSLSPTKTTGAERFFSVEQIYVESATIVGALQTMDDINTVLRGEKMSAPELTESQIVREYLTNSLYTKNPRLIVISWIAYKNTVGKYQSTAYHRCFNLITKVRAKRNFGRTLFFYFRNILSIVVIFVFRRVSLSCRLPLSQWTWRVFFYLRGLPSQYRSLCHMQQAPLPLR